MKVARYVTTVLTVIAYLGSLAEYFSIHPHISFVQAITVTFAFLVIFALTYFFILVIIQAYLKY